MSDNIPGNIPVCVDISAAPCYDVLHEYIVGVYDMHKEVTDPAPWHEDAANFLKAELARAGIGYDVLCQKLKAIGIDESYKGVANKINRGSFSFAFFLQCMKAIGRHEIHI